MIDVRSWGDAELVEQLAASEAIIAAATAEQLAVIAELYTRASAWITDPDPHCPSVHPVEVTAAEIGPALAITRTAATSLVHLAEILSRRLPGVWAALHAGKFTMRKVRILAEHTAVLDDAACAKVEARVLPRASGQTPTGFGVSVRRAVIAADPSAAEARRAAAVRERRVDLWAGEDGMATLRAVFPAADARAAYRGLTAAAHAAHAAKTDGDGRGIGALRADTLVDLLTAAGIDPGADSPRLPRSRPPSPPPARARPARGGDRRRPRCT